MLKNKPTKIVSSLVVMLLSLAVVTSAASAFTPAVKSSDKNLVLNMPQKIVKNQPLNIIAESATRGPLNDRISDITYVWNIDVCGHKKSVTTKLSKNSAAFRQSINGVFANGCKVKVELDTVVSYAPVGNEPGDGVILVSRIDGSLNATSDIKLTGPAKVKVGSTGVYNAIYQLDSNQKATWFAGYACNILKKGFNTEFYPYQTTSFSWQPKKAQKCQAEAVAVYTTTNEQGIVSNIEYATKKLPISSYK
jgi:hypothetical protein